MKNPVNLTLPPFAWLSDDSLAGRNVILHVRSASVIEILQDEPTLVLNPNVITKRFTYRSIFGTTEKMIAALHYSPLVDDKEQILDAIIDPAIEYYCDDCDKQDRRTMSEGDAMMQ